MAALQVGNSVNYYPPQAICTAMGVTYGTYNVGLVIVNVQADGQTVDLQWGATVSGVMPKAAWLAMGSPNDKGYHS